MTAKSEETRKKLASGVDRLSEAISKSIGPRGFYALIEAEEKTPLISRDGLSLARALRQDGSVEAIAIDFILQAAEKTVCRTGGGAKTTTLLACSLFQEGLSLIESSRMCPHQFKKSIDQLLKTALATLPTFAKPISSEAQLIPIALMNVDYDEKAAHLIAKASFAAGASGFVSLSITHSHATTLSFEEGLPIPIGYASPYFCQEGKTMDLTFENAFIFCCDFEIKSAQEIVSILELFYSLHPDKPLILIALSFGKEALDTLIVNALKGKKPLAAIEALTPENLEGDPIKQISKLSNAKVYQRAPLKESLSLSKEHFGWVEKAILSKTFSAFFPKTENRDKLHHTFPKLSLSLKEGSSLEVKKTSYQRALTACKSALTEGVLPGGGVSLLQVVKTLKSSQKDPSSEAFAKALSKPFMALTESSSLSQELSREKILKNQDPWFGLDVKTESYGNLFDLSIFDSFSMIREALENAASIATILLTIDGATLKKKERAQY